MSALADHLERYLELRRAVGYRLTGHGRILSSLVSYLEERGESTVTVRAVQAWVGQRGAANAAELFSVARGFATYLSGVDPATEVPPTWLAPATAQRVRPYLYSKQEVSALIDAAKRLEPALWGTTMATLIGLLTATGLRPGEAYRLERADVDLRAEELRVVNSKLGRSRLLPLHASSAHALRRYARARDRTRPISDAFFVNPSGERITSARATSAFRGLLEEVSISAPPGRRRPRLYDFRHSFAVTTLVDWHRAGVDVQRQLPVLSAYLGHLLVGNTYWYFEATPELLSVVAGRMGVCFEAQP